MDKIFTKTDHNTYTLDYQEVSILVKTKAEATIVLEIPRDQYNPDNISCIWSYKKIN